MDKFDKYVAAINSEANKDTIKERNGALSNEKKLELYSLFKQASVGDCNTDRPGMFALERKAMWDAWDARKGMSKQDAADAYVEVVDEVGLAAGLV